MAVTGRSSDLQASLIPTNRGFPGIPLPSALMRSSFLYTAAGQLWIQTRFPLGSARDFSQASPATRTSLAVASLQRQGESYRRGTLCLNRMEMKANERRREVLENAWVGDAVLSLYARQNILAAGTGVDNPKSIRMTSNRFLSALGEASEVEARIGRIYLSEGLSAAFAHIESAILPLFQKQERRIAPPLIAKTKV